MAPAKAKPDVPARPDLADLDAAVASLDLMLGWFPRTSYSHGYIRGVRADLETMADKLVVLSKGTV